MTDTAERAPRPRRVLIALDSSPASENALAYAGKFLPAGASIRILSVLAQCNAALPVPDLVRHSLHEARGSAVTDAREMLRRSQNALRNAGHHVETVLLELSDGRNNAQAIAQEAEDWNADLLVIGAHQHHGLLRWIEGSTAEPLAANRRLPVLVVPESFDATGAHEPRRILFAVDGSSEVLPALRFGAGLASSATHLRAIHVIDKAMRMTNPLPFSLLEEAFDEDARAAKSMARRVFSNAPGETSFEVLSTCECRDDVAHAIVREADAWRADLLVMGTHGRRGAARWLLGSVARNVARITHTPLLLVNQVPR
ncbi:MULTISPECIES: universal stress protein [unclassified Caballeronia]|uniref:universal stress protein n=1 Tax=unclassified Caballeronia TaxID=2646786 RepID=UPI002029A1F0|nr:MULTISPECIES: universal stress protein [unclassified Caballeronia]